MIDTKTFEALLQNATNKELHDYKDILNREIRLSESAIKEGFEGGDMHDENLAYMGRIYKSVTGTPEGIFLPDNRLGIPSGYCTIETIKKMIMLDINSPEKVEFLAEMMEDFYDQNIISLLKEYKNSPYHIEIILNTSINEKLKDTGIKLSSLLEANPNAKLSITEIERALDIILK